MATMMDSILGMVTPEIKQALAARLGESSQSVQGGLGAATAATLGGLASKAGDTGFLSQIIGLLGNGAGQNILAGLSSIASGEPSGTTGELVNKFLPMVFGSQQGQITSAISQQSGLSAVSATGLLKMAAPLVLGYLGKMHSAGSLNVSSLENMLKAEAPNLQSYLPSGLVSGAAGALSSTASRAASVMQTGLGAATAARPKWLAPMAIAGALLLGWLLIHGMGGPKEGAQTAANVTSASAARGEMVKVQLPDGTRLNVPSLGVEAKLVRYLNDSTPGVNSAETWIDFDRLLFDTGAATLQPTSQEQLGNIAAILKAYPQVKIRIGGFTDNTGDAAANLKLSGERADNVTAELTKLGVDPSRMSGKGYGEDHPVADNSTADGRQKNRRIALAVTDNHTG